MSNIQVYTPRLNFTSSLLLPQRRRSCLTSSIVRILPPRSLLASMPSGTTSFEAGKASCVALEHSRALPESGRARLETAILASFGILFLHRRLSHALGDDALQEELYIPL
jgi:hypothetical protein